MSQASSSGSLPEGRSDVPPNVVEIPAHCVTSHRVRVRFAETDLMAIAHHSSYLLYCEEARVEYLRRRGVVYKEWVARGLHLPVIEARLRYHRTAPFDECLVVETRLVELTRVKVGFAYRVVQADGAQLVATAETSLACVGDDHRPRRLPPDVVALLTAPES